MKTKIFSKRLQLHNVPLERLVFDSNKMEDQYILVDDKNEVRWKIKIKVLQALKITTIDCANLNFFEGRDFCDECFEEEGGYPVAQFRNYIMEVQDSEWIKELKSSLKEVDPEADFMDKAKHFLIPCYDNIIEVIAWNIELEQL